MSRFTPVPLPPSNENSSDTGGESLAPQSGWAPAEHAIEGVRRQVNDQFLYVVKVKQEGSEIAGLCFLLHIKEFTEPQLQEMLAEAVKHCNGEVKIEQVREGHGDKLVNKEVAYGRLATRRKMLADSRTPITESPQVLNERWFQSDVEFIEGVMCDRFDFRKLTITTTTATIEPTIKTSA